MLDTTASLSAREAAEVAAEAEEEAIRKHLKDIKLKRLVKQTFKQTFIGLVVNGDFTGNNRFYHSLMMFDAVLF